MFKGHPKGLFRLFFIEMWERLAFYTMVGILFLYTINTDKGGLGLPKTVGGEIYGLYLAFVYFTPYLGGMIADRFLGYRRSVFIGGLFFALGFFLMGIYGSVTFVSGLVCLCIGNGFFKPNISVMVGNLYEPGDPKRDTGFNIFYMGINIGAFIANYLAAIMRNEYGWLWVFRAAGCGMFIGVGILLWSWKTLAVADRNPGTKPEDTPFREIVKKILGPAFLAGLAGYALAVYALPTWITDLVRPAIIGFLIGMIPIVLFFVRLATNADEEEKPGLMALLPIYVAGATFFMVLHLNGSAMTAWAKENTDRTQPPIPTLIKKYFAEEAMPSYYKNAGPEEPRPNKLSLYPVESAAWAAQFGQKRMDDDTLAAIKPTLPPDVRVVDLGSEGTEEQKDSWDPFGCDIYSEIVSEEITGAHGEKEFTITPKDGAEKLQRVAFVRTIGEKQIATFMMTQTEFDALYKGYETKYGKAPTELEPGVYMRTNNSELYQSLNAFFVIALTPLVVAFFLFMTRKKKPISTARKIFLGMVITTIAVLFMALAGFLSNNGETKVSWMWLVAFYGIVTVGELCLSPMALSLVTKLSPKRFVGLTMGGWFLATAFGNNLSGFLGGLQSKMDPSYFFLVIAAACAAVALFIYLLLPKLDAAIKKYGA
ncbi:MAG: peptide MFS transporter [Planctomycetes bacterium]|nr:peptide MFS transporter [Planctomycetota bacterium]